LKKASKELKRGRKIQKIKGLIRRSDKAIEHLECQINHHAKGLARTIKALYKCRLDFQAAEAGNQQGGVDDAMFAKKDLNKAFALKASVH
jgi:hypothetical protein